MPTVLDSFIVELGLDPKKFTQGQADALAAFKKTREGAEREGKNIEAVTTRMSNSISEFKSQVLGLTAAFLGGSAVKNFVGDLTKTDASLGRTAYLLGQGVQELGQWESAVKRTGGTTEGLRGSIGGLVGELQNITHGLPSGMVQYINALQGEAQRLGLANVNLIDAFSKKGPTEFLLQLSEVLSKLTGPNAQFYASKLGIDPGLLNVLVQNRSQVEALLEEARRIGTPSKEATEQAKDFQKAWEGAAQAVHNVLADIGRVVRATEFLNTITKSLSWWRTPEGRAEADKQGEELHDKLIKKFGKPPDLFGAGVSDQEYHDKLTKKFGQPPNLSGTTPAEAAGTDLRVKPGAGVRSPAVDDLAKMLQSDIPGLNRFTAFDDRYHTGFPSAHGRGQALDFTINDPAQSAAVSAAVEAKLRAMGVSAKVLDEYKNPSSRATGGHIHVQFESSAAAAAAFSAALRQAPGPGNLAAGAAGAANVSSIVNGQRTNTTTSSTKIDTLNVITPESTSPGIAKDLKGHIERQSMATQANYGAA